MARWLDYFQIWPKAYRFPKDGLKFFQILIQAIENCPKTCKIGQISPNLVTLYQARLSLSWRLVVWTVQKLFVNWTNMILFPFKLCQPNKQNIPKSYTKIRITSIHESVLWMLTPHWRIIIYCHLFRSSILFSAQIIMTKFSICA